MSLHTNFHAPRTSLYGRIQIGHKSGYLLLLFIIYSVNIKPPRHRFGFSLAWGWQLGIFLLSRRICSKDAVIFDIKEIKIFKSITKKGFKPNCQDSIPVMTFLDLSTQNCPDFPITLLIPSCSDLHCPCLVLICPIQNYPGLY